MFNVSAFTVKLAVFTLPDPAKFTVKTQLPDRLNDPGTVMFPLPSSSAVPPKPGCATPFLVQEMLKLELGIPPDAVTVKG